MIARTDRVSTVIGLDESFIDVFVALSPAFERLRNAGMRKMMSRLVTVEQAARMAGVDADELVARLNAQGEPAKSATAAAQTPPGATQAATTQLEEMQTESAGLQVGHTMKETGVLANETGAGPDGMIVERPDALVKIPVESIVTLDVREDLRAGREPFSRIMAARREVPDGGALSVRATFEPVPLYAVMKRQGLEHWTEQLDTDDWRAWFYPPDTPAAAPPSMQEQETAHAPTAHALDADAPSRLEQAADPADPEGDIVIVDVRDLEPPEPMVRTLAALEQLPAGRTLLQINVRVPQFLLPILEERGFRYDVREQEPGLVRVFIRHAS